MHITRLLKYTTECVSKEVLSKAIPTIKTPPNAKVIVWGTSHLAEAILLELKLSPLLKEIRIYGDKKKAIKISDDLNHIGTDSMVTPYYSAYQMACALQDIDVIVLAGGYFGTLGESKHCLFKHNLPTLLDMAYECARHNPTAAVVVLTPPTSRNVPMISELYERLRIPNSGLVMSPMYQYEMIAAKAVADYLKLPSHVVSLPVVGGCCEETIIPVFSQASPQNEFTEDEFNNLIQTIRGASDRIAKYQKGNPPTLTPAMAASKLVFNIIRGRFNMPQQPQSVFLRSDVLINVKYLGTPIQFGPAGVEKYGSMPQLTDLEFKVLAEAVMRLQNDMRIAAAAAASKWNEID